MSCVSFLLMLLQGFLAGILAGREAKYHPIIVKGDKSCSMTDRIFPTLQVVIHRIDSLRVTKEGPPLTNWANSAVLFL